MTRPNFFYKSLRVLMGSQDPSFSDELALRYFQFRYYLNSTHSADYAYNISASYFGSLFIDYELRHTPGKNAASRITNLLKNKEKRLMYNAFFSRQSSTIANGFEISILSESDLIRRELENKHIIDMMDMKLALANKSYSFGFDTYKKLSDAKIVRLGIADFTFRRISEFPLLRRYILYVANRMSIDLSLSHLPSNDFVKIHKEENIPSFNVFIELFSKVSYLNHMLGGPWRRNFDTMLCVVPIKIDPLRAFSDADLANAGLGRRKWRRKWDLPPTLRS